MKRKNVFFALLSDIDCGYGSAFNEIFDYQVY